MQGRFRQDSEAVVRPGRRFRDIGRGPFASKACRTRLALLCLALAFMPTVSPGADIPAPQARLATRALLLDVADTGARVVAVGMQGVIITSDDAAATWTQASVPVSAMLTSVAFADPQHGWAAGHLGVILTTADGGRTWSRTTAETTPDDSFLDVIALPENRILAAGAYGLYFVSQDNGATWERKAALDEDLHINRITRGASGTLYLAAEAGVLASSTDAGETWDRLESPYEGSFYGLHEFSRGRLFAHGLRGHVFISDDQGATWTPIPTDQSGLLATAVELSPGYVAVSGASGLLLFSRDGSPLPASTRPTGLKATAEIVALPNGEIVCVGDAGVFKIPAPKP